MSAEKSIRSWEISKPLSPLREFAAVWMFVRRQFRLLTFFRLSFITGLLASIPQLIIFGVIAKFGQSIPEVQGLSGGYVNFVISGLVINTLLATALSGPYRGLMDSFWNDRIEIILTSPLRLPVFVTGLSAGNYLDAVLRVMIIIVGAALFLGFSVTLAPILLAAPLVLVLGLLACTGLGLAAASSVYTLDARGGQDPIILIVETLSGLVAGVFFPLQLLPHWAQWTVHLIPHTYAIDGMRRAMFGSDKIPLLPFHHYISLPPIWADCLMLAIYAAITLPVGWKLFQYGLRLARMDGRLSRWT
jgi:ABC-2 type transport system permease protein